MNFCDHHKSVLVTDLELRGLAAFCSDGTDEERMMLSIADAYHHGVTLDNFDPLALGMSDLFHVVMGMFEYHAIELMMTADLGYETCPVCFLDRECPSHCPDHDRFVHAVADKQLAKWRRISS